MSRTAYARDPRESRSGAGPRATGGTERRRRARTAQASAPPVPAARAEEAATSHNATEIRGPVSGGRHNDFRGHGNYRALQGHHGEHSEVAHIAGPFEPHFQQFMKHKFL